MSILSNLGLLYNKVRRIKENEAKQKYNDVLRKLQLEQLQTNLNLSNAKLDALKNPKINKYDAINNELKVMKEKADIERTKASTELTKMQMKKLKKEMENVINKVKKSPDFKTYYSNLIYPFKGDTVDYLPYSPTYRGVIREINNALSSGDNDKALQLSYATGRNIDKIMNEIDEYKKSKNIGEYKVKPTQSENEIAKFRNNIKGYFDAIKNIQGLYLTVKKQLATSDLIDNSSLIKLKKELEDRINELSSKIYEYGKKNGYSDYFIYRATGIPKGQDKHKSIINEINRTDDILNNLLSNSPL